MSDRPLRSCDVCGKVDDHPRHIFDNMGSGKDFDVNEAAVKAVEDDESLSTRDAVRIVLDLKDTTSLTRHMDCCRAAGCPTGDCDKMPEEQQSLKGNALVAAITGEKVK